MQITGKDKRNPHTKHIFRNMSVSCTSQTIKFYHCYPPAPGFRPGPLFFLSFTLGYLWTMVFRLIIGNINEISTFSCREIHLHIFSSLYRVVWYDGCFQPPNLYIKNPPPPKISQPWALYLGQETARNWRAKNSSQHAFLATTWTTLYHIRPLSTIAY